MQNLKKKRLTQKQRQKLALLGDSDQLNSQVLPMDPLNDTNLQGFF